VRKASSEKVTCSLVSPWFLHLLVDQVLERDLELLVLG